MLTIGQLAERAGLRTSALRYYEQEGLLAPDARSEAGYRLYKPEAAQRLHLIQRAQRLGFSLADIRTLLNAWSTGDLSDEALLATAEDRYLALEEQITELLILQHELERFLQDLRQRRQADAAVAAAFDELVTRVCANPLTQPAAHGMLDWLMAQANCRLTTVAGQRILAQLRGQHVHVWQEEDAYRILVVSRETAVGQALQELANLEADCDAHPETSHQLTYDDEGYLFTARGPNAFLFARLFLALEQEDK